MKCFTFTIDDLMNIKEIVSEYVHNHYDISNYPQIQNIPFRITLKAKPPKDYGLINPDCVISFIEHDFGIYDMHYETANSMLLNCEGIQRPFDFQITLNSRNGLFTGHRLTKAPSQADMLFLDSQATYKFGVDNKMYEVFFLACQCAQFMLGAFGMLLDCHESGGNEIYRLVPDFVKIGKKIIKAKAYDDRRTRMLNGWDTVSLTNKQLKKVVDTLQNKHVGMDFFNYALTKFCFAHYTAETDTTCYMFYTLDKGVLNCAMTTFKTQNIIKFNVTFKPIGDFDDGIDMSMKCDNADDLEILNDASENPNEPNWKWVVRVFFIVNTFMLNYGDVSFEVEEKIATAPTQSKKQTHRDRNTSQLFKTYTLKKTWASAVARKHTEITCPCWGVRGHFRHYKNGKTVFIEPFTKGRDRAQYKGKEYALMPYKEA